MINLNIERFDKRQQKNRERAKLAAKKRKIPPYPDFNQWFKESQEYIHSKNLLDSKKVL